MNKNFNLFDMLSNLVCLKTEVKIIGICDGLEDRIAESIKPLLDANMEDIKCKFYRIDEGLKDDVQIKKR